MTVLAIGDVRGFYDALGIDLPGWAEHEAPTRCFASPESHKHDDRSPSTSVNLLNGAWCCHGCGAHGGAYDAALAIGHTPRSAMELLIRHGLAEPRPGWSSGRAPERAAAPRSQRSAAANPRELRGDPTPAVRALSTTDEDVRRWHASLSHRPSLLDRLAVERGWRFGILCQLDVGLDTAGRVTIPIRNGSDELRGVLRYQPWHTPAPKMLAIRGTRLGLIPHPAREPSAHVVLVEGPADMLAARAHGIPAIAVPGTHAWKRDWRALLDGRRITIVMDCDAPGREAARRIEADLARRCEIRVIDLDPGRNDGYDLTDALLDGAHAIAPGRLAHLRRSLERGPADNERGIER